MEIKLTEGKLSIALPESSTVMDNSLTMSTEDAHQLTVAMYHYFTEKYDAR